MSGVIEQMIEYAWAPPPRIRLKPGARKDPKYNRYYRKWGFTIYRTYYSKESDEYWQSLLYSLRHQTKLAFGRYDDEETDQDDRRQVQKLFYLEVCEDPIRLGGLDVYGLREFLKAESRKENKPTKRGELSVITTPDENQGMADYLFDHVLLADETVLKDIERGISIVKAVSLSWDGHTGGYGWVRIPTGYLLDLWTYLMWNDDRLEIALRYNGSEEDLAQQVWPGDMALDYTGKYSEIRPWRHYSNQDEMY
ncbi:hypothetical protein ACLX1H_009015 [Fusarium chlamydosporum]